MNNYLTRAAQYILEGVITLLLSIYFALPPKNIIEEFAMITSGCLLAISLYCFVRLIVTLLLGIIGNLKTKKKK